MRVDDASIWWIWSLNRRVAEFIHSPTEEQEIQLRFLLTTYRAFNEEQISNLNENPRLAG